MSKIRRRRKIIARSKIEQDPMPQSLFSDQQQHDSTHFLMCPRCNLRVYVGEAFTKAVEAAKQAVGSHVSLPQHEQCNALMQMIPIDASDEQVHQAIKEWQNWDDVKRALEG